MDADPKTLRTWGRILSTLLQTPDDELDDFVRERLAGAKLDTKSLAKGRALLMHLGRALDQPDADRWKGIEHALSTLEQWEQGLAGTKERNDAAAATSSAPTAAPAAAASPVAAAPLTPVPPVAPAAPRQPAAAAPSPWMKGATPATPMPAVAPAVAAPPAAAASAPAPSVVRRPLGGIAELNETAPVGARPQSADPLPFRGQAATPPARVASLEPNLELGSTVLANSPKKKGPTLPFAAVPEQRAPASEPPISMTLERYAELCVERSLWPDNQRGRRARFGLDEAGEAHADAYFRPRFDADPGLRQRWVALCAAHRKKLGGG